MATCCVTCMDEDETIVFNCTKVDCRYQLCAPCVKEAFGDASGANSKFCLLCGTPSALEMIKSVCGQGAIRAVEERVRAGVEFKIREENAKKHVSKQNAAEINDRARQIFNSLADEINLKCPRCKMSFTDYDGCNALTCGNGSCKAGFCAVCLQDCHRDAHEHVRSVHGTNALFDKSAFERNKVKRAEVIVSRMTENLEPFELKQLVLNHVEKAKLTQVTNVSQQDRIKVASFLEKARGSLLLATQNDRLALLSSPEEYDHRKLLTREDISPRCAIPNAYRLTLDPVLSKNMYIVSLDYLHRIIEGEEVWESLSLQDIESHFKNHPKVDSLLNLKQAFRCAVVAFDGHPNLYQTKHHAVPKNDRDEACITFAKVSRNGDIQEEDYEPYEKLQVVGLNQNKRMILLERHVKNASESDLMFSPLKHLIGAGRPTPLLTEIQMDVPESHAELNMQQRKVGHPLCLKTAQEVAGPPGTGKTKTIVELVRALLCCTDLDILLLSERNGAINAVADKFKSASLKMARNKKKVEITDLSVWFSVMTYGAGESMGECTKLFTLEEKLNYHPELLELKEKLDMLLSASKSLAEGMREKIAQTIDQFGTKFSEPCAFNRSQLILDKSWPLSSPLSIISLIQSAACDIEASLSSASKLGQKYAPEEIIEEIVVRYSELMGKLIYIRSSKEKKDKDPWDAKDSTRRFRDIGRRLQDILQDKLFQADHARDLHEERLTVDKQYKAARERLENELPTLARLHMSTIGSSHRLPGDKNDVDSKSIMHRFGRLSLEDDESEDGKEPLKKTVVIFDESGCIPSYELLGLTRLGRPIESLVLVGDKHQLPPYDATQGRNFRRVQKRKQQISLLDSSALTGDTGKIMLTTQYRVPQDIADMLNARIYGGNYKTCPRADVPLSGLRMINVPKDRNPRKKYVNSNEVNEGLRLINNLTMESEISSILVITPYKNQQREFEFQLKKKAILQDNVSILTIDQCQGQEADAVIFSVVQRPTRFLTKNRLNVALSRVRKQLFVLVDFEELRSACGDRRWESAHMAADLLLM